MLKKIFSLCFFLFVVSVSFLNAQTTAFAYVKNEKGEILEQVNVDLKGTGNSVRVDKIGYFQFVDLTPGDYQIVVYKNNFETQVIDFTVKPGEIRKDLGVIVLKSNFDQSNIDQGFAIVSDNEDDATSQSTVGLLQSSQDVFSRLAAYDLGIYWFRPRGLDGRSSNVLLNGVSTIRQTDGNTDFSAWGGLNDITRYPEIAVNHSPSEYFFGGVNSVVYKNTKASEYRKGTQIAYSVTNRNYRNRIGVRHSTGMSKSGWAFTGMITKRWAREGRVEGSFYDSYGIYLGVEKKFNDKHTVTFNVIASPTKRGGGSPNTKEAYDYRGIHYNAYWGWQNGKKRHERIRQSVQPILQLTDYWKINKNTELWTTLSYQFGKTKASRINYYRVRNPQPIYYRNLPSQNPDLRDAWINNDQSITQINWNELYRINQAITPDNFNGVVGRRAAYYVGNDVISDNIVNVNTHFVHNISDNARLFINAWYQNYHSDQYAEVKDLLGADFAINLDPFARSSSKSQYDQRETNFTRRKGDRINYNYTFLRQEFRLNPSIKYSISNFDFMLSTLLGFSLAERIGKYEHYLYKNSLGRSQSYGFMNFGVKGQVVYKINGRHFLIYNGAHYSQAPFLQDLFFNPRVNADVVNGIQNVITTANDLSYVMATPFVKAKLTGYLINTKHEVDVLRFYADGINLRGVNSSVTNQALVTQFIKDLSRQNLGVEFGIDAKLTSTFSVQGLASYGRFTYANNPEVYVGTDAIGAFPDGKAYSYFGQVDFKNYRQSGTPQVAYLFGVKYNSPKYWWVGATWNYFDHSYLAPTALIRTDNFLIDPQTNARVNVSQQELDRVRAQRRLPAAHFVNINAGKSLLIGKYYLLITASINNLLNNKKYITSGFEQTRDVTYAKYVEDFDKTHPSFGPKYWYFQGLSYFVNLQFRF